MKPLASSLVLLVLILSSVTPLHAESQEHSPRLLSHLLDYLANDYPRAVANGEILSAEEYEEQREFSAAVMEAGRALPETRDDRAFLEQLGELQSLIERRSPAERVSQLARDLQRRVIVLGGIEIHPSRWPNYSNGASMYSQHCASCHGLKGDGVSALSRTLSPAPTNFLETSVMKTVTALHAFNTIRLGIPGTAMVPFRAMSDSDVWDVSFYVLSLRYIGKEITEEEHWSPALLKDLATKSDEELLERFGPDRLTTLRLHIAHDKGGDLLMVASLKLDEAVRYYGRGNYLAAKTAALEAYLEGIEPLEPRIRATDGAFVGVLEKSMLVVRLSVEEKLPLESVQSAVNLAQDRLEEAQRMLEGAPLSPLLIFIAACGIILREGFEAVLVILAMMSVLRVTGETRGARYVHAGWLLALFAGSAVWIASGYIMPLDGAGRELMEGAISLFAAAVLLLFGCWLHSQAHIAGWKEYITQKTKTDLQRRSLLGLAVMSFFAVFREALETVIFLRALWLEGGSREHGAMCAGLITAACAILLLSWTFLRFSVRIPIGKLFAMVGAMMGILAVILMGKGIHSLQEAGRISVVSTPFDVRWEFFGIYPTMETLMAQIIVIALAVVLWKVTTVSSALSEQKP